MRIQKSATVYPVVNGGKNFINLYERIKIMKNNLQSMRKIFIRLIIVYLLYQIIFPLTN